MTNLINIEMTDPEDIQALVKYFTGYRGRTPLGDLYQCQHTGIVALKKHMIFVPAILPQAPGTYSQHNSVAGFAARKLDIADFNENDANCNTCKNFIRQATDKVKGKPSSGFVFGQCSSAKKQLDKITYKTEGFEVTVPVADWLGIPCWEARA